MFVRKKENKSGIISVQVIDKSTGKYKVIKSIGSSADQKEIGQLYQKGKEWVLTYEGQQIIDFSYPKQVETFLDNITEIQIAGTAILIGKIFNKIGFNKVDNDILKYLTQLENFL